MNELIRNLADAGCDDKRIAEIRCLYENGDITGVVRKLRTQRGVLMEALHESQKKVDCLDFLLREITQSKNNGI